MEDTDSTTILRVAVVIGGEMTFCWATLKERLERVCLDKEDIDGGGVGL